MPGSDLKGIFETKDPNLLFAMTLQTFPSICFPDGSADIATITNGRARISNELNSGTLRKIWDTLVQNYYTEIQAANGDKTKEELAWVRLVSLWYSSPFSYLANFRTRLEVSGIAPRINQYDPFRGGEFSSVLDLLSKHYAESANESIKMLRSSNPGAVPASVPTSVTAEQIRRLWDNTGISQTIEGYARILSSLYIYPGYYYTGSSSVFGLQKTESEAFGKILFLNDLMTFMDRYGVLDATGRILLGQKEEELDPIFESFLTEVITVADLHLGETELKQLVEELVWRTNYFRDVGALFRGSQSEFEFLQSQPREETRFWDTKFKSTQSQTEKSLYLAKIYEGLSELRQWAMERAEELNKSGGFSISQDRLPSIEEKLLSEALMSTDQYLDLYSSISPGQSVAQTALMGALYLNLFWTYLKSFTSTLSSMSGRLVVKDITGKYVLAPKAFTTSKPVGADAVTAGNVTEQNVARLYMYPFRESLTSKSFIKEGFKILGSPPSYIEEPLFEEFKSTLWGPEFEEALRKTGIIRVLYEKEPGIKAFLEPAPPGSQITHIPIPKGGTGAVISPGRTAWEEMAPQIIQGIMATVPISLTSVLGSLISSGIGTYIFGAALIYNLVTCSAFKEFAMNARLTTEAQKFIAEFIERAKKQQYPSYSAFLEDAERAISFAKASMEEIVISAAPKEYRYQLTGIEIPTLITRERGTASLGTSVLINTHLIDQVLSSFDKTLFTDRIKYALTVRSGRVVQRGKVDSVLDPGTLPGIQSTSKSLEWIPPGESARFTEQDIETIAEMTFSSLLLKLADYLEKRKGFYVTTQDLNEWVRNCYLTVFSDRSLLLAGTTIMSGLESEKLAVDRTMGQKVIDTVTEKYKDLKPFEQYAKIPEETEEFVKNMLREEIIQRAGKYAIEWAEMLRAAYPLPTATLSSREKLAMEPITKTVNIGGQEYQVFSAPKQTPESALDLILAGTSGYVTDPSTGNRRFVGFKLEDPLLSQILRIVTDSTFVNDVLKTWFLDQNGRIMSNELTALLKTYALALEPVENKPEKISRVIRTALDQRDFGRFWQYLWRQIDVRLEPVKRAWMDARETYIRDILRQPGG